MRRLGLVLVFLILASSIALAHDGAISLYKNAQINDCDDASAIYERDTIQIFYVRGTGPDMGNAAEFKFEKTSEDVEFFKVIWSSEIVLVLGDWDSGYAITGSACLGSGLDVVYLGTLIIDNIFEFGQFRVYIGAYPDAGGIYITKCDQQQTMHGVLGGTFVFNGSCNPATEVESWGAIKSLFK